MPLTEETKEMLRNSILMQLAAARPVGLRTAPIHVGAMLAGFQTLPAEELANQLRYLESHGMIERAEKEISKAVEVFMITEAGVAHLDESGLI
jgi:hypothetical protein